MHVCQVFAETATYSNVDCPSSPLQHSICIVHTLSQRLWGHSEVCVYIDGKVIRAEKMKGPDIQEV